MKKMIIGLVLGLLIGTAGTALAVESETVQAAFAKFVIIVNGEEKVLDADPLVYQGNTYLPVRTVSNMLGYDVTYKADSRTIELDSAIQEIPSSGDATIVEVDPVDDEWMSYTELAKNYGLFVVMDNPTNSMTISNESVSIIITMDIDSEKESGEMGILQSNLGLIQYKVGDTSSGDRTLFNLNDFRIYGLIN